MSAPPRWITSQILLSLALSEGYDVVVKIILGRENANSDTPDRASQASPPPSAVHRSERTEEMRFGGDNLETDIVHLNSQSALQPAEDNAREVISDF